jgi:hypothetical protein
MGYTGDEGWETFSRATEAWCETAEDCDGQGLVSECESPTWQCAEALCSAECGGVDPERCSDLEGAIDDGIGMNGMTLEECIEQLGGVPIRAELEACCAADELYFFCSDL